MGKRKRERERERENSLYSITSSNYGQFQEYSFYGVWKPGNLALPEAKHSHIGAPLTASMAAIYTRQMRELDSLCYNIALTQQQFTTFNHSSSRYIYGAIK